MLIVICSLSVFRHQNDLLDIGYIVGTLVSLRIMWDWTVLCVEAFMQCEHIQMWLFNLSLQVNEEIGLSPGYFTARLSERLAKKRKAAKEKAATHEAKKRRSELKSQRGKQESSRYVREGATYATAVELDSTPADITEIPSHQEPAHTDPLIFVDLETTGLGKDPDIVQLSAVGSGREVNRYICPNKYISTYATRVTGFSMMNGCLHLHGHAVNTVTIQEALLDLLELAKSCGRCILIGHNIRTYDIPILYRVLHENKMVSAMQAVTRGCVDTLQVARKVLPKTTPDFKQTTLVSHYLGLQYGAHDALEDVRALQSLHSTVLAGHYNAGDHLFQLNTPGCAQSLKPLVEGKFLSKVLAGRVAASGIGLQALRLAHTRDPEQGIALLLKERKPNGKPRVTSTKSVIDKLDKFFHV